MRFSVIIGYQKKKKKKININGVFFSMEQLSPSRRSVTIYITAGLVGKSFDIFAGDFYIRGGGGLLGKFFKWRSFFGPIIFNSSKKFHLFVFLPLCMHNFTYGENVTAELSRGSF